MIDPRTDRSFRIVLYVVAALATAAYLGFVYAYPKIFPYIHQADPENYRENVQKALAAGDVDTAIEVARFATKWFSLDVDAHTLLGELLTDAGKVQEAQAAFEKATNLTTSPEWRSTRLPYFNPRARLGLGLLAWQQGDALGAVTQFELAWPRDALPGAEFARYHQAMFEAYAAIGAWSRAIRFAEPTTQRLGQLDHGGLISVMAAAEGAQRWELLGHAGRALLSKDTGDPSGQYAVGRAFAAQENTEDAIQALETATELGHPEAPYFLGVAQLASGNPAAAVEAFRAIPEESIYYPFGLAQALAILRSESGGQEADSVEAQLSAAFAKACPIALRATPPLLGVLPWTPVALRFGGAPGTSDPLPVVVRWRDESLADAPKEGFSVEPLANGDILLRHGAAILHFQWAANAFPLADFEQFEMGVRPPGWFDPDSVWNTTHELPVNEVVAGSNEPGRVMRIANDSGGQRAVVYAPPVTLEAGAVYVLAARMHAPETKAVFGWEMVGSKEERVAAGNAVNQRAVPEWSWQAIVTQAQYPWKWARTVLGVFDATGAAEFDDVRFLTLSTPGIISK